MLSPQSMHYQNFDSQISLFLFFWKGTGGGRGGWGDDGVVESGGGAKTIVGHFI